MTVAAAVLASMGLAAAASVAVVDEAAWARLGRIVQTVLWQVQVSQRWRMVVEPLQKPCAVAAEAESAKMVWMSASE